MFPREAFRSSAVRLAIALSCLFLVTGAIAIGTAFYVAREELVRRHHDHVAEQFNFFADLYQESDPSDLTESLDARRKTTRAEETIAVLQDAGGRYVAGNPLPVAELPPTGKVSAASLGLSGDVSYYTQTGRIGGYTLMIADSNADILGIEDVFFKGMAWAIVLLGFGAAVSGTVLTRRMNRRFSQVETTLERVSEGDFQARIPVGGAGDDIGRIGELINQAISKLGGVIETNRQISSDIAHDLRTPMNRILIAVEQAAQREEARGQISMELAEIAADTKNVLGTFDALLRISEIESRARRARFVEVDLKELVGTVADFYSAHAEDSNASLSFEVVGSDHRVLGDRELLTQLFANLIENSLKHAGAAPHIVCGVIGSSDGVTGYVKDNGPGIPEDERQKVTRRHYRLQKSRTTPGSGLGLSMVQAIAELHDAALTIDDAGPGLVVAIKLRHGLRPVQTASPT